MNQNVARSIHQRLLNKARESSRPFNELLQYYAIERFIYRLSKTLHASQFTLKGALMLSVWSEPGLRQTMDIDLLGRMDNSVERISAIFRDVCNVDFPADGVQFDATSVVASRIAEDAEYEGVRVLARGHLGNARIHIQVDIGFGDVVVPGAKSVTYPTILDLPAPSLKGYTMESTIAEKFQAMVKLGILNSRMKDFYDIWMLARRFDFSGEILAEAVARTFAQRATSITSTPSVFHPSFSEDHDKKTQWAAFIRKMNLNDAPESFEEVVTGIKLFLEPITVSLSKQQPFRSTWTAPGPWA